MNNYTITLTISVEAEDIHQALEQVKDKTFDELNNGENAEVELA